MWYVVQVPTGREDKAVALIRRFVGDDVLQECFTPRYSTQMKVRGEWKRCERTLFPGYVIAGTDDVDALRRALKAVPEFTKLLTMGETFLPLDKSEAALIEALTKPGKRTVEMSMGVMEGDRIIVTEGPLQGQESWIRSINRRKSTASIEVEMFGRTLKVQVGLGIVTKR